MIDCNCWQWCIQPSSVQSSRGHSVGLVPLFFRVYLSSRVLQWAFRSSAAAVLYLLESAHDCLYSVQLFLFHSLSHRSSSLLFSVPPSTLSPSCTIVSYLEFPLLPLMFIRFACFRTVCCRISLSVSVSLDFLLSSRSSILPQSLCHLINVSIHSSEVLDAQHRNIDFECTIKQDNLFAMRDRETTSSYERIGLAIGNNGENKTIQRPLGEGKCSQSWTVWHNYD